MSYVIAYVHMTIYHYNERYTIQFWYKEGDKDVCVNKSKKHRRAVEQKSVPIAE